MPTPITVPPVTTTVPVRRIVACTDCGGRRRALVDTAQGLRAHCMGCGAEVAFPFATENAPLILGRAGQVMVHG
jgi:DNA-directed RNA polymerase subunit RPC12/RpoP